MSDAALSFGLGIFTGQARPGSGIDVSGEYRAIPEIAAAAEARGFAAIWLSEHHGADDSYLPSPMPMLAAVAAVTHRIRLGTAVLVPALHDPVRLAEDIAVVDQLSAGRVTIGFGLGWRSAEFAAAGVKLVERVGRTTEAIALLRHLFCGNPAPFAGRYHRVPHPRLRPLPFQPGGPPILLAGSQEASIRRAARIADGLIYSRTGPTAAAVQPTLRHIADALRWIDEGFGPRPGQFPVTLLLNLALAEDGDPLGRRGTRRRSPVPHLRRLEERGGGRSVRGRARDCRHRRRPRRHHCRRCRCNSHAVEALDRRRLSTPSAPPCRQAALSWRHRPADDPRVG